MIAASVILLPAILLAPILLIRFRKRWVAAFTRPNGASTFSSKKPWTLSDKVEFMLGVGREWIHERIRYQNELTCC
jgi:hypothetical protein